MINSSNQIPGMIELVEQEMLVDLSKTINLDKNDQIIEFGSFFGRSTFCLAKGLKKNNSKSNNKIITYDSFICREDGVIYPHLLNHAKLGNVENLIEIKKKNIDFENIFRYFLNDEITNNLVCVEKAELENSYPIENGCIALMHIDSPKFYNELKPIISRFFPKLKVGAFIVFQDYFYHWSATLIAAIQLLKELKIISFEYSKATSLCTKLIKTPTTEDLLFIDNAMKNNNSVINLLNRSIIGTNEYPIDRADIFVHRIYLAKI